MYRRTSLTGDHTPELGRRCEWWIAWVLAAVLALWYLLSRRVPATFYFDEWDFVLDGRPLGWRVLLEPHNGHLSLLPVLWYRLAIAAVGAERYELFRAAGLVSHAAVATATARYVMRRHGPVAAFAAGVVVLLLGAGWEDMLWPFQIGFMTSMAAGIAAWLAVDRATRRADVLASTLLTVSLASSGVGIAFAVGTAVRCCGRRETRCLLRVVGAPAVLFAMWWLSFGTSQGGAHNLLRVPRFVVDAAATSSAALLGRDALWGRFAVGAALAALILSRRNVMSRALVPPASVCTTAVAGWTLTAWSRADVSVPGSSRYMYVGAVLVLLLGSDAAPPLRAAGAALAVSAFAVISVWGNHRFLVAGSDALRESSTVTRVELRTVEWAPGVMYGYRPDVARMPQVSAGAYAAFVARSGSPAADDAEVLDASPLARAESDRVALEASGLTGVRSSAPPDVSTDVEPPVGCTWHSAGGGSVPSSAVVARAGAAFLLRTGMAGVELRLRRLADEFAEQPDLVVPAESLGLVEVPADNAPIDRWAIDARSPEVFEYCIVEDA